MQSEKRTRQMRYKKTKFLLGQGGYKTVTKAIDEEEGKEVAYNEIKIKGYEDETKSISTFSKEIAMLKSIDHPHILKIIDYWTEEENFCFITEYMAGGSLSDYLKKNGPLSLKLIKKWGKQILEGLHYLHSLNPPVIHRDIKNDNIFVNTAIGEVKIGDLGLSKEKVNKRYTILGTPQFMAREMFEGDGYNEKVDIYAFGMSLIEMATAKRPYNEFIDANTIYKNVLKGVLPESLKKVTNPCLKSLIVNCIVPLNNRFTAEQCLNHHFFNGDISCKGDCIPKEAVAIYPLDYLSEENLQLSILSISNRKITFQMLLLENMKFIKFEYDLNNDTVQKICTELLNEKIISQSSISSFSNLILAGLKIAEVKIKEDKIHDGIIEIDKEESDRIKERNLIITNLTEKFPIEQNNNLFNSVMCDRSNNTFNENSDKSDGVIDSSSKNIEFGTNTLEEMKIVEERMKLYEASQLELSIKEKTQTFRQTCSEFNEFIKNQPDQCSSNINDIPLSDVKHETVKLNKSDAITVDFDKLYKDNSAIISNNYHSAGNKAPIFSKEYEAFKPFKRQVAQRNQKNTLESLGDKAEIDFPSDLENFSSLCSFDLDKSSKIVNENANPEDSCAENIFLQFPNVRYKSCDSIDFSNESISRSLGKSLNINTSCDTFNLSPSKLQQKNLSTLKEESEIKIKDQNIPGRASPGMKKQVSYESSAINSKVDNPLAFVPPDLLKHANKLEKKICGTEKQVLSDLSQSMIDHINDCTIKNNCLLNNENFKHQSLLQDHVLNNCACNCNPQGKNTSSEPDLKGDSISKTHVSILSAKKLDNLTPDLNSQILSAILDKVENKPINNHTIQEDLSKAETGHNISPSDLSSLNNCNLSAQNTSSPNSHIFNTCFNNSTRCQADKNIENQPLNKGFQSYSQTLNENTQISLESSEKSSDAISNALINKQNNSLLKASPEKTSTNMNNVQSPLFNSYDSFYNAENGLSDFYENSKIKYRTNASITIFALDCAYSTGRSEETAKSWIKALKEEHIETVFDLKLMTYEDWERLPLTVFSSRVMRNMLYGLDGAPLREKHLPANSKIADYDAKMSIKDFLQDVCEIIGRTELVCKWEDRFLAEDIQTVGELKQLHDDDWNRLGLSVFGYRILKNTILKKGKISIELQSI